jgi:hypothetical protein
MRNPPAKAQPMAMAKPAKKDIGGATAVMHPFIMPSMMIVVAAASQAPTKHPQAVTVTRPLNICGISTPPVDISIELYTRIPFCQYGMEGNE